LFILAASKRRIDLSLNNSFDLFECPARCINPGRIRGRLLNGRLFRRLARAKKPPCVFAAAAMESGRPARLEPSGFQLRHAIRPLQFAGRLGRLDANASAKEAGRQEETMRNAQPAAWPPPSAQADPTLAYSPVRAYRRPPSVGRRGYQASRICSIEAATVNALVGSGRSG
jgi:hypothetical protein